MRALVMGDRGRTIRTGCGDVAGAGVGEGRGGEEETGSGRQCRGGWLGKRDKKDEEE